MKISVVTPLARPYLASVSAQSVAFQTGVDVIDHIIVGGNLGNPGPEDFYNKVACGINASTGDVIAIFEDDDFYESDWLQYALGHILSGAKVVGCGWSRVYNLMKRRYLHRDDVIRGPFAGTVVFSRSVTPHFLAACKDHKSFKSVANELDAVHAPRSFIVTVKGLPGGAVGVPGQDFRWHEQADLYPCEDPDLKVFRQWVGDDMMIAYTSALKRLI